MRPRDSRASGRNSHYGRPLHAGGARIRGSERPNDSARSETRKVAAETRRFRCPVCGTNALDFTHAAHRDGSGLTVKVHCHGCGSPKPVIAAALSVRENKLYRWPPPPELGPHAQRGYAAGREAVRDVSQAQVDGWASALWANPRALSYLRNRRGLTYETILEYELGCKDGTWITMPVWNEKGRLVNVKLRSLNPAAGQKDKTRNGAGDANLYPDLPASHGVLVVFGEIDALIGRQMDLPTVTPTCGAGCPPWIQSRFKGKRVFVMADVGEDMAASAFATKLRGVGDEVFVVDLGRIFDKRKGDLNDFYRHGGTREQILALIRREWRGT
jgi:hypothetical protein